MTFHAIRYRLRGAGRLLAVALVLLLPFPVLAAAAAPAGGWLPGDVPILSALECADGTGADRPVTRARARQMLFELARSGQLPAGAPSRRTAG